MQRLSFSLKLAFLYGLAKLKWVHPLLPDHMHDRLPVGWNFKMFWVAFKTGGTKIYDDYYCEFRHLDSYRPKADVEPQFQLSEAEIKSFYDNGFIGPFNLHTAEEIDNLRKHLVNKVIPSDSPWTYVVHDGRAFADWLFNRKNDALGEKAEETVEGYGSTISRHLDDEKLLALFRRPEITKRCAQLIGPDILLVRSNFFEVKAHTSGTKFHQASTWLFDNMLESTAVPVDPDELWQVTCWIALTDADEENGCLVMIPGSHDKIYPLIINRHTSHYDPNSPYKQGSIDYPFDKAKQVPIPVKAGQFILFTERMIHGSMPNKTDRSRWAVNCRFTKTDTRLYSEKMLEEGVVSTYGAYKNISMDKWRAVLVHGEDRFGYNRLLVEPKPEKV